MNADKAFIDTNMLHLNQDKFYESLDDIGTKKRRPKGLVKYVKGKK